MAIFKRSGDTWQLGEWMSYVCDTPQSFVCKGSKSPDNAKPSFDPCPIDGAATAQDIFAPFRNNCYAELGEDDDELLLLPWDEAEGDCTERGGHLASILDWTEQAYLFSRQLTSEGAWIGLNHIQVNLSQRY